MKMRFLLSVLLFAVDIPLWGGTVAEEIFRDGARIVFFGDSITHNGHWHGVIADWCLTHYPERDFTFFNAGVGGDTAARGFVRVREDVEPCRPTAVISMFGMNDVGRKNYCGTNSTPGQIAARQVSLDGYKVSLAKLGQELSARCPGARLAWLTPSPYDDKVLPYEKSNVGCDEGLAACADIVRNMARLRDETLFEVHAPMRAFNADWRAREPGFTLCGTDGIHPKSAGGLYMAWCCLRDAGVDPVVSETELDARSGKVVNVRNAAVSDLQRDEDRLSFTLFEKSLPLFVRPGAETVADRIPFAEDLSRETLRVSGLPAGTWRLVIDGQTVLSASAEAFASGVDLARHDTPQYRQSKEIVMRSARITALWDERQCYSMFRHFVLRPNLGDRMDDRVAVTEYVKAHRDEPASKTNYFWRFADGYVSRWPVAAAFDREVAQLRAEIEPFRRPVSHRYELSLVRTRSGPTREAPTTDGTALVGLVRSDDSPAAALQRFVDKGEIAGAVSMVAVSGKVETASVGLADPTTGRPFDAKTLFWIASMTKGFCGAAVMSCVDKGLVCLDDPVEKYIPEIANVKVGEKGPEGKTVLRPPKTKMTLRMCLAHVAGFPFSTPLALERGSRNLSMEEHVKGAVACPLLRDPLVRHQYSNVDINLAGRIVEIVTGMPFEDYLQKAFFDPLDMRDITFYPSAEQLSNKVYVARLKDSGPYEDGREDKWAAYLKHTDIRRGREHAIAAGGLYSTAADVMKFYLMLANDGKAPDGRRILSHAAIVELSRAQYPALDRYTLGLRQFGDWFGHDGALQTEAYANWKENRAALLFVQVVGTWRHPFKQAWRSAAMHSAAEGVKRL